MAFSLPNLPYEKNALSPVLSKETLEFHHGKHHAAYVEKLNNLLTQSEFKDATLTDIIKNSEGALFNNAAQHWNHTFYWHCMRPTNDANQPVGEIRRLIEKEFDSYKNFCEQFIKAGAENFASGWTWLVKTADEQIKIVNTDDADNPLTKGDTPLLTCDVWEHAYYIDYRNARGKYLENFWKLVNWEFIDHNLNHGLKLFE